MRSGAAASASATTGWPTSPPATTWASTSTRRSSTAWPGRYASGAPIPSWSRLLGSPRLYCDIEEQLTELLGAPDTLVLPTITHIHTSVIPILAGKGWVFVDKHAHKTIYDGASIAVGRGATMRRFQPERPDGPGPPPQQAPPACRRLVCMDGVNSMTGNMPDLAAFARVAREHDALLYVDDAHGFGVIGERDAGRDLPVRAARQQHRRAISGQTYDNIVLVGGFSKAYSSLLAFLALPTWLKNHLKVAAAPVPVLRAVADRLAGHRSGRFQSQRGTR